MNELQIFNSEEFGDIRTVTINNEPWFVGKDVAEALGYSEPRSAVSKKIDEADRGVAEMETPSGKQNMTIINESGLYALIFGSKLESAKRFKHWVTSEVLPAIRKTGSYQKSMTIEEQLQIVAKGTLEVKEEIHRVDNDLQNFKADMPLLALECQRITRAKNQKVVAPIVNVVGPYISSFIDMVAGALNAVGQLMAYIKFHNCKWQAVSRTEALS